MTDKPTPDSDHAIERQKELIEKEVGFSVDCGERTDEAFRIRNHNGSQDAEIDIRYTKAQAIELGVKMVMEHSELFIVNKPKYGAEYLTEKSVIKLLTEKN